MIMGAVNGPGWRNAFRNKVFQNTKYTYSQLHCLSLGYFMSEQKTKHTPRTICYGISTCCNTETQNQPVTVSDTGPTSPSTDFIKPGVSPAEQLPEYQYPIVTRMTPLGVDPGSSAL